MFKGNKHDCIEAATKKISNAGWNRSEMATEPRLTHQEKASSLKQHFTQTTLKGVLVYTGFYF